VVGVADASKLLEILPNKIRDVLGIVPCIDLVTEDGKDCIRITIEPYPYPVSYKGQYHVRSGGTKQKLTGPALKHFLLHKIGKHWDEIPAPEFSLADLDAGALTRFRRRAVRSKRLEPEIIEHDDALLLD